MITVDSYRNGDEGVVSPLLIKTLLALGGEIEVTNEEIYSYKQRYVVDAYVNFERATVVYKLRRIEHDIVDGEVVEDDQPELSQRAIGSGSD